ncbi:hypothetical protein DSUL_50270 [Desulfovibrionales bacterium]
MMLSNQGSFFWSRHYFHGILAASVLYMAVDVQISSAKTEVGDI